MARELFLINPSIILLLNSIHSLLAQIAAVFKTFTFKNWAILIVQFAGSFLLGFIIFFVSAFVIAQVVVDDSSPRFKEMLKKADAYIAEKSTSSSGSAKPDSIKIQQALVGYRMGIKVGYLMDVYVQKWMIYGFVFFFSLTTTALLFFLTYLSKPSVSEYEESVFWTVISHLILFGIGIFTKRSAKQFSLFYDLSFRTRLIAFAAYVFIFGSVYANAFSNKWIAGFQSTDVFILVSIIEYGSLLGLTGLVLFFQPFRRYGTWILRIVSLAIFIITLAVASMASEEALQAAMQSNHAPPSDYSFGYQSLATFLLVCGVSCYLQVARRVIIEKQAMEGELILARRMQEKLLPEVFLQDQALSAYGNTICASEVGGDYFDYVPLTQEGTLCAAAVGDVSGHNMAAGVLMAILKSAFRSELRHRDYHLPESVSKLTAALNETISDLREKQMFVSFSAIIIDSAAGFLYYANAGHLPLLHFKAKEKTLHEVYQKTPALGLLRNIPFPHLSLPFESGDFFILFTDGLTEAATPLGDEFGMARLSAYLIEALSEPNATPQRVYEKIVAEGRGFSSKKGFSDDVTLFILKV